MPPVLRAQLIEFNSTSTGFLLSDFDSGSRTGNGSNNTLFLYPSSGVTSQTSFSQNIRPTSISSCSPGEPSQVSCSLPNLNMGGYACSATLTLPNKVHDNDHSAYLILKSFYRGSTFRVTLLSGGSNGGVVQFDGVQPVIDSTGRANDLFRRVQARVLLKNPDFSFPQAEVDVTGNLCKNFKVTDKASDFPTINTNLCTP